jgi:hypothetical protein
MDDTSTVSFWRVGNVVVARSISTRFSTYLTICRGYYLDIVTAGFGVHRGHGQ